MDNQEEFNKQFTELIETISEAAKKDGFDDYWLYNQCLQGDYILKNFFEEYYKKNEGLPCCADKASFTLNKIKEMINKKQVVSLQETYRQYQENGGDIGAIKDLDKIAYWCPKTIKDSKEAIELFYKNTIKNKPEELEYKIKIKDEVIKELEQVIKDISLDKQKLIDKLEEDIFMSEIECRNRERYREDVYGHIKYKTINNYAQEILLILKGENSAKI